MFLYEKKIVYLSRYRDGKKEAGAGFARITGKSNEWCMDIKVKKEFCHGGKDWFLYLLAGDEKIPVENIAVQAGEISFNRSLPVKGEKLYVQGRAYSGADILGIEIRGNGGTFIAGYLKETAAFLPGPGKDEAEPDRDKVQGQAAVFSAGPGKDAAKPEKEKVQGQQAAFLPGPGKDEAGPDREKVQGQAAVFSAGLCQQPILQEIRSFDNKWEQLMNDYPQIHPFGDDRVFISIEPKDFIVLCASYQKLVNNSFLLHGFYNYRYLILGPDKEIGERDKECFYLGVPGTYFERERMVAVMFGFEGFECAGPVEIGKFGFYMRRVEL